MGAASILKTMKGVDENRKNQLALGSEEWARRVRCCVLRLLSGSACGPGRAVYPQSSYLTVGHGLNV